MMKSMNGRICLVTGGTDGMGKEIARGLAQKGATVIITGRNPIKGKTVQDELRKNTGNPHIEFSIADFSSLESVRNLASEVLNKYPKLHVLVNNVGGIFLKRTTTHDDFETTFGVNNLAPFLLTNLLLDRLKESAPARIINVSSNVHSRGKLDFDDLQYTKKYTGMGAYSRSKLANILFTYELARRLEGTNVTTNCLHPGWVKTDFSMELRKNPIIRLADNIFAISPIDGAATSIFLASDSSVEGVSGKYFIKNREKKSSKASYDVEAATKLWVVSEQLVGLKRI
ncbi:SDR family oxidoreductase [Bacillus wiedmannii]|uniref:SDR family oxidoreductase n=1 Tax=Bacillus wiedmannii TaxID=1890302 RepID=UPI003D99CAC2